MSYHEAPDPRTGKAPNHQEAALKAARNISNAEIKPIKRSTVLEEQLEELNIYEKDAKIIEDEVGSELENIESIQWSEGLWVMEATFENGREYYIFENEDDAIKAAEERVKEDIEDYPEWFMADNGGAMFDFIDGEYAENFFREMYYEWNTGYVNDIEDEDDDEFTNRLASEMYNRGLISYEEATDEDFDLDDKKDKMSDEMTQEAIDEGNYGFDYYKFNFGDEAAGKLIKDNEYLVDADGLAEHVVSNDGAGNTLSSYDGIQVDLDNEMVIFRTN